MSNAPHAPQRSHPITRHGETRIDPYYWLMDRESEEVLSHLRAENEFVESELGHLNTLQDEIYNDMKSRIEETDTSVPVRRSDWWHFGRTREGASYGIVCRAPVQGDGAVTPVVDPLTKLPGEQVVLDENEEIGDHDFLSVGVLSISPDDAWVAVGVDFEGNERHTVTIRPLNDQTPLDDELLDVYYSCAWASDSRHFFYTRVDDAMRPWQVWRHEINTSGLLDVLVFEESDAQYSVGVERSRDGAVILISTSSSTTSEIYFLPADNPTTLPVLVEARRLGIEYGLEHYSAADGSNWWLKVTNENATDFRLCARPSGGGEWRELVAERPGNRLDGVDAFATFLALSERVDGCAAVRIIPLPRGLHESDSSLLEGSYVIKADVDPSTVVLGANAVYDTTRLRISLTSMITPSTVADVNVTTGDLTILKQQIVRGGYNAENYVTGRLWVGASDGQKIPVTLVGRRDLINVSDDGTLHPQAPTPFLLYGYGSYEASMDPYFSSLRLSLLDRGVIFAIAHIRGGGEMGRSWYEMGKLAQKPTTFSDFVAVGRSLVAQGWTTSDQFAARGGSAGGLLMGAVMNLDPDLFTCVVAEVPFVDALTTMLDASLPLTIGEWEEWGNPDASPQAYRTMRSYSPYDNIRKLNPDGSACRYPHVFATGGLNDSRVGFWEPAKWVLALRDANAENIAYLKTEMGAGHGGPSGRYDSWKDEAQVLAFVVDEITTR
ncbi:MAG: S9 family peptidase [Actinomycetota bacterium]